MITHNADGNDPALCVNVNNGAGLLDLDAMVSRNM